MKRRRADAGRQQEEVEEVGETPGWWASSSTGVAALGVTAARWGAWALLILGPVLGGWALASSSGPVSVASERPAQASGPAVGAAGFAQMYVSAWLRGDGSDFYPGAESERDAVRRAPAVESVSSLAAVTVRREGPRYWAVTVAAEVTWKASSKSSGSAGGAVRYFQVPVRQVGSGGGLVALSWPAQVGAPPGGKGPALAYGSAQEAVGSQPLVGTLRAVFGAYLGGEGAYLGGEGALDRYVAPGARIAPVRPAPYARIEVERVAEVGTNSPLSEESAPREGQRRQLLVELAARTSAEEQAEESVEAWPLTYAVELRARDGRWEVAALDAAPALETKETAQ